MLQRKIKLLELNRCEQGFRKLLVALPPPLEFKLERTDSIKLSGSVEASHVASLL